MTDDPVAIAGRLENGTYSARELRSAAALLRRLGEGGVRASGEAGLRDDAGVGSGEPPSRDPRYNQEIVRLGGPFYVRIDTGPDLESALLCLDDGEPDTTDIAKFASLSYARAFIEFFDRRADLFAKAHPGTQAAILGQPFDGARFPRATGSIAPLSLSPSGESEDERMRREMDRILDEQARDPSRRLTPAKERGAIPPAPAVMPEGWQAVPKTLTPQMRLAAIAYVVAPSDYSTECAYAAMLAAAPPLPGEPKK